MGFGILFLWNCTVFQIVECGEFSLVDGGEALGFFVCVEP